MSKRIAVSDPLGKLRTAKKRHKGEKMSDTTTTTPTTLFDELEAVVAAARVDYDKLRIKGVQSRSTDFRKKTQQMRKLIDALRKEAVELRAKAHDASKAKKAAKAAAQAGQ